MEAFEPFDLYESDGEDVDHTLLLNADEYLPAEDVVDDAGHIANGHFWTAVARYLICQHQPALANTIQFDPEAGTFAAYGDRDSLVQLHALLLPAVTDPDTIATLIDAAGNDLFA